ncbi:uncharacterized protein SPPG_04132 [Spizellomyces punctatus DAOM BR117]|uniref:Uncharacterized protein n=1 Tax=Spizellomyces punctatus (strain DAOM BR117) TaxID=645134 RepID=A0A0L0HJM9_SPIPD|nr:uncharacterized protein SPPG_04132 [Spizellomyces punctatus DAOM BR117]KND01039.1 hypothetical protein SPPG_04132 [Spizellomyces punctatus DAOM BR117]|eukprot:XP_016609078.1 hypothetical protein SPPG_04132 [Spizellomyces punctatus DAOM BR117]
MGLPQILVGTPLPSKVDEADLYNFVSSQAGFQKLLYAKPYHIVQYATAAACEQAGKELQLLSSRLSLLKDLPGQHPPSDLVDLAPEVEMNLTSKILFIPRKAPLGIAVVEKIVSNFAGFKSITSETRGYSIQFNDPGFASNAAIEIAETTNLGIHYAIDTTYYPEEDVTKMPFLRLGNTGHNVNQITNYLYSFPGLFRIILGRCEGAEELTFYAGFADLPFAYAASIQMKRGPLTATIAAPNEVGRWMSPQKLDLDAGESTIHIKFPFKLPDLTAKYVEQWLQTYNGIVPGVKILQGKEFSCCIAKFTRSMYARHAVEHLVNSTNMIITFTSGNCPTDCSNSGHNNVVLMDKYSEKEQSLGIRCASERGTSAISTSTTPREKIIEDLNIQVVPKVKVSNTLPGSRIAAKDDSIGVEQASSLEKSQEHAGHSKCIQATSTTTVPSPVRHDHTDKDRGDQAGLASPTLRIITSRIGEADLHPLLKCMNGYVTLHKVASGTFLVSFETVQDLHSAARALKCMRLLSPDTLDCTVFTDVPSEDIAERLAQSFDGLAIAVEEDHPIKAEC